MIKGSYNYHVNEGIRAHCNQVAELYLPGNSNFPWTYSSAADCNRLVAKVPRISHIFFYGFTSIIWPMECICVLKVVLL